MTHTASILRHPAIVAGLGIVGAVVYLCLHANRPKWKEHRGWYATRVWLALVAALVAVYMPFWFVALTAGVVGAGAKKPGQVIPVAAE